MGQEKCFKGCHIVIPQQEGCYAPYQEVLEGLGLVNDGEHGLEIVETPEQGHISLYSIGNVNQHRLEKRIRPALFHVATMLAWTNLEVGGMQVNCTGRTETPELLSLKVGRCLVLNKVHELIARDLEGFAKRPRFAFSPHMSTAYIKDLDAYSESRQAIARALDVKWTLPTTEIALYSRGCSVNPRGLIFSVLTQPKEELRSYSVFDRAA